MLKYILISELLNIFIVFNILKALLYFYTEILKVFTKLVVSLFEFIIKAFKIFSS